jgi:hypothetical protein
LCVGCGGQRSGGKKGKRHGEQICFHGNSSISCAAVGAGIPTATKPRVRTAAKAVIAA